MDSSALHEAVLRAGRNLEEFEWHLVGLYHIDSKTYGPVRGPEGTHAEQFAFIFKDEE